MSELSAMIPSLPGASHAPVLAQRLHAASVFTETGLPTTRSEDWKYTDISRLTAALGERWWEADIRPAGKAAPQAADIDRLVIPGLDAWLLVLVDGRVNTRASNLPPGVSIHTLAEWLEAHPEQAPDLLAIHEDAPLYSGFIALNAAMAGDGLYIHVDDGTRLTRPLYILHLAGAEYHVAHIRHTITLGRHAGVSVIEHFSGDPDAGGLTNTMTGIRLGQGARLSHYRLQQEPAGRFHIGRVEVAQQRDSHYDSCSVALGAALSRTDIRVNLAAAGAACTLNGLYVTGGRQHADHHTRIDHAAPNCTSRELYKGILDGRSRAVFNGKVVVHADAQKTDARQSNGNLLLSGRAEVDAKPELEIYADDVKCAHGATIGQLDEHQVFYLRTRGLSEADARNALTFAFARDALAQMQPASLRAYLEHTILARLPRGKVLEDML